MLDIKFIREYQDAVKAAVKNKGIVLNLDELLAIDDDRRKLITEIDELRKFRNEISEKVPGAAFEERPKLVARGSQIKQQLSQKEGELREKENLFQRLMLLVPNVPSPDTPIGGEEAFRVVSIVGRKREFGFSVQDHVELGKSLDIFDFERGAKVGGFRGYYLKNEGVLLHLGILHLALKRLIQQGYTPMIPPTLVREMALVGSGHFPHQRQETYELEEYSQAKEKEQKFLVGTSEPSLLAYHAEEVLAEKDLPRRLTAISPCYRREVGGYGKDTRGVYRVHEFMKVEQVVFCKADLEESEKIFEEMSTNSRKLLEELELPYRVIQIASGDMGAGKYKMYDIETWMPGRNAYGETHSNSNLTDWQTRRLNIRYRDRGGKMHFPYALNNTMIASPRILIAILENYQQADGSVAVPKILQEFVGKDKLMPK